MSDIYGHLFGMPFARYDPTTQSWRTSLDTSLLDLPMSSLTLPKSGGMRNGQLFEHPMLEPVTEGSAYSSLPTPHAGLGERGRHGVILNPKGQQDLQHAIAHLLPTPTVNDMGAGKDPQKWQEWAARQKAADGRPAPHGKSLEQEAISLLPTPNARDHKGSPSQAWSGQASLPRTAELIAETQEPLKLLPTPRVGGQGSDRGIGTFDDSNLYAVMTRLQTGGSMQQQLNDGETSSGDQRHHQLSLEEMENLD